jgi:hypothetical protein
VADNVIEFLIKGDASDGAKAFGQMDKAISGVTKVLGALGVAFGALEFAKFIGNQIEVADQMGKMALKSGVAVDAFSQMSHAFALSDVSAEELAGGFKFLNKAIDEAKQGNDAAQRSFESIGISMSNLKHDSPNEVMLKLADAFTQIEDPAARNTMLLEKFGRAGLKLAPAMEEGRAGIEKLMKQADALGLTVDKEFAAAADRFGDSMQTVRAAIDGAGRQLGKSLLPILQETIDNLFDFGGTAEESILPWGKITVGIVGAVAAVLLSLVTIVKSVTTSIAAAFQGTGQMIGASMASIEQAMSGNFAGAIDTLKSGWNDMGKVADGALTSIDADLLKTGASINKMNDYVQSYGQTVTKTGEETKKASEHKLNPVSKEAATRLETLRQAVLGFISTMDKATAAASGNKLAAIDAEYNSQLDAINNLKASEAQKTEMLLALNTNYAAQRVALNDSMLAQLGVSSDAYRARQTELIQQDADRMALAGMSAVEAQQFVNTSLLNQQAAYLSAKNSAISDDYKTQDELAVARYEEEVVRLQLAREMEFLTKAEFDAAMVQAEITKQARIGSVQAQAELARLQVTKMTFGQQLAYTSQALNSITGLMQTQSKEGFRIGKAAAIAQAVINTYTAATGAYASASAIPIVGWILGPIAAIAAIALGMKNVQSIRSQQMGQAHAGMTNIPSEGSYLLDKGERVIQPEQNKDLTNFLSKGEEGGGGVQVGSVSISVNVPNGDALRGMTRRDWEDIVTDKVIPALNVLDRKGVRPDSVQRYDR